MTEISNGRRKRRRQLGVDRDLDGRESPSTTMCPKCSSASSSLSSRRLPVVKTREQALPNRHQRSSFTRQQGRPTTHQGAGHVVRQPPGIEVIVLAGETFQSQNTVSEVRAQIVAVKPSRQNLTSIALIESKRSLLRKGQRSWKRLISTLQRRIANHRQRRPESTQQWLALRLISNRAANLNPNN